MTPSPRGSSSAVATVHSPFIVGRPDLAPPERKDRVYDGFDELRAHVESFAPDVIVAFSNEHITNFVPSNVPAYCVTVGASNPTLPEFRLPETRVPGAPEVARDLVTYAYDHGFDVAYSEELLLDHGTGLPLRFLTPSYDIPVIAILQNVIFDPMPTLTRAYDLGLLAARFVREEAKDLKVLFLGTGGISHWVGNQRHGDVNADFDEWFLEKLANDDIESVRQISQAEVDAAGDGANEIRNWVAVAAAAGELSPRVVLGETFIPGWNTSAYQVVWN